MWGRSNPAPSLLLERGMKDDPIYRRGYTVGRFVGSIIGTLRLLRDNLLYFLQAAEDGLNDGIFRRFTQDHESRKDA
jgi:hypothetical protein